MLHVPSLTFVDLLGAALLFAVTWGLSHRRAWPLTCVAAVVGWIVLATADGLCGAFHHLDYNDPLPATPLLVPSSVFFAAFWIVAAVARLLRWQAGSIPRRVIAVAAGVTVAAVVVVAVQWPRESWISFHCEDHLRNQWFALRWYSDDHDGKLPPLPGGQWERVTKPYYTYRPDLLKCPGDYTKCTTSYSLTPAAAGRTLEKLSDETVVLIEKKPRHHGKAHALLADGVVVEVRR